MKKTLSTESSKVSAWQKLSHLWSVSRQQFNTTTLAFVAGWPNQLTANDYK